MFSEWGPADKMRRLRGMIDDGANDPLVHELAAHIIAPIDARDAAGEAAMLLSWVQTKIRYTPERVETFQSARYTLEHGFGDCDDLVVVLGALLESIVIPTQLEVLGWTEDGVFDCRHIFLRVGLPPRAPTEWVAAEPTLPVPFGWEPAPYAAAKLQKKTAVGL
jgi:transglutaminase-like putative cysteine protease